LPFRVFGSFACSTELSPDDHPLLEFAARLKPRLRIVSCLLVFESIMPLDHFLGFMVFRFEAVHCIIRYDVPLFRVLLSSRVFSSDPSRPGCRLPTPHLGFCSLQHQSESQVHITTVLPSVLVTSSGFDFPLDVLLPAIPSKLFFKLTALLGFTPSKLSR
jgi:hypothetical protein